jgi:hypothetical protein
MDRASSPRPALPPWRRLAVHLAVAFAALTVLSVAIVGVPVRERQKGELENAAVLARLLEGASAPGRPARVSNPPEAP